MSPTNGYHYNDQFVWNTKNKMKVQSKRGLNESNRLFKYAVLKSGVTESCWVRPKLWSPHGFQLNNGIKKVLDNKSCGGTKSCAMHNRLEA